MIFTGIKRKSTQIFFNKQLIKSLKKAEDNRIVNCEKLLVILDDLSDKEQIEKSLKKYLNLGSAHIVFIILNPKKERETNCDFCFSPKDFGYYGKIKNSTLKSIITKNYDLLINYSKVENIYNNLLTLLANAKLKVGKSDSDDRLYDLMIACEVSDYDLFNSEMQKYLAILNDKK